MAMKFEADLLPEPATFRSRFTATGRIRKEFGGGSAFQVARMADGSINIWTVGPMGWWHDFQKIPDGTSFDDALFLTHIPSHYGWER